VQGVWIVASFSCETVLRADESITAFGVRPPSGASQKRKAKERSMRKGLFASVAALAAGAGVALGQGVPMTGPGYPSAPGPGPGDPNGFLGGAPAPPPPNVPPAGDMPLYGQVGGPDSPHPINPVAPKYGFNVGQLHKAAGGPDRFWVDVEENVWAIRSMPVAFPLLTTGPPSSSGVLGQPGTSVLLGDENLERHEYFSVFRITGGIWDDHRVWGLEGSGFISERRRETFDFFVPSTGSMILARPIIDAGTGAQTSFLVAVPGQFSGFAQVDTVFQMGGAEGNLLYNLMYCDMFKANFLAGIRYVDTTEALTISSTTELPNAANPQFPIESTVSDQFKAHNQFLGGQIGLETELRYRRFFVDLTAKIAAGNVHEKLNVDGFTFTTVNGLPNSFAPAGLLALVTNSGKNSHDEFAYVPEGIVKFGWQWTQRISTYVGYNGLYISRVLRPGEQIDPVINTTLVPSSSSFGQTFGPARPLPVLKQSDFWAQGVIFGLSIRY
jgi:hypothetical protein